MVFVSILAALGAACSNSLAGYLQQSAGKQLSSDESVPLSQLPHLVREPRWLAGQAADASAFLLQAVALAFGALVFVEPMLVLSLPITIGLRSWSVRHRPRRLGVGGSLLAVAGISIFLGVGSPTPGGATITATEAIPLWISVVVLLTGFLGAAKATSGNARGVAFAAAAATVYGVTAGLTKVVTTQLHGGVLVPLESWEIYCAVLTGVTGVFLTQNALKPGALAAPVAVITVGDPLVAIAMGLLWLGETVNAAPWAIAAEVLAVLLMASGVVLLALQSESASAPAGGETDRRRAGRS